MNAISTWEILEACYAQSKPRVDEEYDEEVNAAMANIMKLIDAKKEFDVLDRFVQSKLEPDDGTEIPTGWFYDEIFDVALRNDHIEIALIFAEHAGVSLFRCYEECMENGAGVAMAEKIVQRMSYSDVPLTETSFDIVPRSKRCSEHVKLDSIPFDIIQRIDRAKEEGSAICEKFFTECLETRTMIMIKFEENEHGQLRRCRWHGRY